MSESFKQISELSMKERYDQFITFEYLTFLVILLKIFQNRKHQKSKEIHWRFWQVLGPRQPFL